MRKSKAETAKTREKIVSIASEAIRKRGIEATGVAEIMAAAGLTHGGFYRHFDSKEKLVAEALATSRKDFVAGVLEAAQQGPEAVLEQFRDYATPGHRDDIGAGCPLAANGSEIVRADAATRHRATEGFRTIFETAAPFMRADSDAAKTETAISLLTNMIGALTIARMVDDPKLSKKILDVTRRRIEKEIAIQPAKSRKKRAPEAIA
jgi:TetR/AcrR family transcriptional repressor of nem operon